MSDDTVLGADDAARLASGRAAIRRQFTWDVEWFEAAGGEIERVPFGVSARTGKSPPRTFTLSRIAPEGRMNLE